MYTLSCIRSKDAATLQAANTALNSAGFFGTFVFVPVIDGEFIVRRPSESLKMGRVNAVCPALRSVYLLSG